mmetsp:Transcript_36319/g.86569  ORF Transcript_36319/g.86569 Transcript_36319/m.86569 type:complete len:142 (-) Transcript_36319:438-863(-)
MSLLNRCIRRSLAGRLPLSSPCVIGGGTRRSISLVGTFHWQPQTHDELDNPTAAATHCSNYTFSQSGPMMPIELGRPSSVIFDGLGSIFEGIATWFIKRTYQPSIIRKRRKHGFMRRKESVGGRRVLKRRMAKGRKRMGGS